MVPDTVLVLLLVKSAQWMGVTAPAMVEKDKAAADTAALKASLVVLIMRWHLP
jgi:hypothetical protein